MHTKTSFICNKTNRLHKEVPRKCTLQFSFVLLTHSCVAQCGEGTFRIKGEDFVRHKTMHWKSAARRQVRRRQATYHPTERNNTKRYGPLLGWLMSAASDFSFPVHTNVQTN